MTELMAKLFPGWEAWGHFWHTLEFGREGKLPWVAGFALLFLLVTWVYRRDTMALGRFWKVWLVSLRVLVLLALLVVALVPQERKSRTISQPSRVVLLADTSISMSIRDQDKDTPGTATPAPPTAPSRAEAVRSVLEKSPLIQTLRATHDVSLYTFDSQLVQHQVLQKVTVGVPPSGGAAPGNVRGAPAKALTPAINWAEMLKPRGLETRLGEALLELVRQENGETLSGIVLLTDGGSNAGVDPSTAAEAAAAGKVRLFPVGVGSTKRPVNLQLAEIQAPTHVHIGDGFTLSAYIAGQGLANQTIQVELLSKQEQDEGPPTLVATKEATLLEDGVPVSVPFDYVPSESGRRQFVIRAKPTRPVQELVAEDNEDRVTVEVIDRKTKVLLLAGGPMRDYQFVRNLLHRDKSIEVDVLLQTGTVGISQEADNLLFSFPDTREDLFAYDVIVAFDPNWKQIAGDKDDVFQLLSEWVYSHAGGLVLIAGEVNTPQLASTSETKRQLMQKLLDLYPVVLDAHLFEDDDDSPQPWPVEFTREGLEAEFLQLTDNPATSTTSWKEFAGIFRCYPTDGPKAGATVYARFTDPRAAGQPPILLASQYFGSGRVMYLGSAETWRLRALEEDYFDRLWVKMVREVGQGRLLRGTNRGILLLEKKHYPLGATVQVRARVLDPQFKDYSAERVVLEVRDPSGRPLSPAVDLIADKTRPGHFTGAFVATLPGNYSLELPIPESKDQVKDSLSVKLPNLEFDHPEQNDQLLRSLASQRAGGGRYLRLDEAAALLPQLVTDRSTQKVQFDFPRTLWDKQWVMYVLVGLLSLEWLTRKLLKLA